METPEELAHWLEDNKTSQFADMKATYEQWLTLIKNETESVSCVGINGKIIGIRERTKQHIKWCNK